MENTYLTESDYLRILSFIEQTKKYNNDFQQHVLNLLNSIFGYQYATFNLINHKFELYNPKLCNITEKARDQYYEHYHKTDIFNPKNTNLWLSNKVISITDIMTTSQYEQTEYYLDFLKSDMLYYELVLPLVANNRLIGGIGVFKQKDEDNFTDRDIVILNRLNQFIASDLWSFLEYSSILKDCQTYNSCFDETPTGIIILDKNFSIKNCNKAAEAFADKIQTPVQQFIYEIISKLSHEFDKPQLDIKFLYKFYRINIIRNLTQTICSGDSVYVIFISEKNEGKHAGTDNFQQSYDLTSREYEILELVKNGLSNEEIAEKLYISIHTVKSHMENIFKKLQVKNRTAALYKICNPH
jgi:DNA-binding CsgD family transcriptional regulator